jgi:hypothetical protein
MVRKEKKTCEKWMKERVLLQIFGIEN